MKLAQRCLYTIIPFLVYANSLLAIPSAIVTNVTPNTLSVTAPTTPVTITGTGFLNATEVHFGSATITIPANLSDTTITINSPSGVPGAFDVAVTTPSGTSFPTPPLDRFTFTGDWIAYVTYQNGHVVPVNLKTQSVGAVIGIGVTGALVNLAIQPDGRLAFCTNNTSNNQPVIPINLSNNVSQPSLPIPASAAAFTANNIAISPNNTLPYAYVTDTTSGQTHVINISTGAELTLPSVIPFASPNPAGIAVSPDGKLIDVINSTGSITEFNILSHTLSSFGTMTNPQAIAYRPDGKFFYVTDIGASNNVVHVFQGTTEIVAAIDVGTATSLNQPPLIAVAPNGTFALVSNFTDNTVSQIDLQDGSPTQHTVVHTFSIVDSSSTGLLPRGIAITPDSATAYVVCSTDGPTSLCKIDMNNLSTPFEFINLTNAVSDVPVNVVISPDQAPIASFEIARPANSTDFTISFDASASFSPVGTIKQYAWNFGDGSPLFITTSPTTTHTYTRTGIFSITLTVTNTGNTSTLQTFTGQTVSNQGDEKLAVTTQQVSFEERNSGQINVTLAKYHDSKYALKGDLSSFATSNIAYFELYAGNTLVEKIPNKNNVHFKYCLSPRDFYKTHIKKYIKYLDNKYKIRAVNTDGSTSGFTPIHVNTIITKNNKKSHRCQSQVPGITQGIIPAIR